MKTLTCMLAVGLLAVPATVPGASSDPAPATGDRRVADDAWGSAVARFARSVIDADVESLALASLTDDHSIRTVDGRAVSLEELVASASTARWSRMLRYASVPDRLASDLAAVASDDSTDPRLRRYLTPVGDSSRQSADLTALKWVSSVLAPRADQPVGVLALHEPGLSGSSGGKLTIILFSGERVGARLFRVRNVVLGRFDVTIPAR